MPNTPTSNAMKLSLSALLLGLSLAAAAQRLPGFNYDEAKVPPYTLLDPLRFSDGRPVSTAKQWPKRRAEIFRIFEENEFGHTPEAALHVPLRARVLEREDHALNGLAVREQVELTFSSAPGVSPAPEVLHSLRLLIYLPAAAAKSHRRSPVVLGLNFEGNQSVDIDPAILPTPVWSKPKGATDLLHALPPDGRRGSSAHRWPVRMLLERGYGLVTAYYGDLEPDFKDASQYSVRRLFAPHPATNAPNNWGALAAWAWGMSRALDYLLTDPLVDGHRVAANGHSRLGKAAAWVAAQDSRFAALLSNESGHGGQTIQRRAFGETVARMQQSFPYWFCPAYAQWAGRDTEIPADGNLLLSLVAPRPLYVGSAEGDEWSDPKGEFLSARDASRVYRLLGKPALPENTAQPAIDHPVGLNTTVAYHERSGKHDVTDFDWQHYLDFLDAQWGRPGN